MVHQPGENRHSILLAVRSSGLCWKFRDQMSHSALSPSQGGHSKFTMAHLLPVPSCSLAIGGPGEEQRLSGGKWIEDEGEVKSVIIVILPDRSALGAGPPCLAESIGPETDWWDKSQILPKRCCFFIKRRGAARSSARVSGPWPRRMVSGASSGSGRD